MKISNFKLAIGFPCSWSHIPFHFFISFLQAERPDFSILTATNGHIDGLRNKIVEDALKIGASHLIMMDIDQVYPSNTIIKLLSHRLPIVGCLVHRRYPPFDPLIMRGEINKYQTIKNYPEGLIEVDATGTGCLLFDMKIFRKMPAPWFKFRQNPDHTKSGVVGEDIGFCSDLKKAGHRIFVDTTLKCGHLSTLVVSKETHELYTSIKKHQKGGQE